MGEFDYVIINDQFEVAIHDLMAIVRCQRLRGDKQLIRNRHLLQNLN